MPSQFSSLYYEIIQFLWITHWYRLCLWLSWISIRHLLNSSQLICIFKNGLCCCSVCKYHPVSLLYLLFAHVPLQQLLRFLCICKKNGNDTFPFCRKAGQTTGKGKQKNYQSSRGGKKWWICSPMNPGVFTSKCVATVRIAQ